MFDGQRPSLLAMKLALIGLKGHVGSVLDGAKQLGDVEIVAV